MAFLETSALDNSNVQEAFLELIKCKIIMIYSLLEIYLKIDKLGPLIENNKINENNKFL